MPTPSFEKRLRRNTGNTVKFTVTGDKNSKVQTVQIKKVVFDPDFSEYVLVGRDVSNIAKRGSPTVTIPTWEIKRPVRYSTR